MEFPVDSKVKLKSGSPELRVVDASGHYCMVSWIEADGRENRTIFPNACLAASSEHFPR